jgi:hypothetical protein
MENSLASSVAHHLSRMEVSEGKYQLRAYGEVLTCNQRVSNYPVGCSTYLTDSMIWISCLSRPFTISPSGMPF